MKANSMLEKKLVQLSRKSGKKSYYFRWKFGLDTKWNKYSTMTEEEFRKKYKISDLAWISLKRWEGTNEYIELANLYFYEYINRDLFEIYNTIREKAKEGDDKAIKNFFILKQEIEKSVNTKQTKSRRIEQEEAEEDNLVLE